MATLRKAGDSVKEKWRPISATSHLSFDSATGREMKGDHCCIVLMPKAFNARFASHGSIP
jgi:hypothetical protein